MSRVLLLNATFEPLQLVSERRAVVLMLAGRAEAIATPEEPSVCRSASLVIEVPAIVRLHEMVKLPEQDPHPAADAPLALAARQLPLCVLP